MQSEFLSLVKGTKSLILTVLAEGASGSKRACPTIPEVVDIEKIIGNNPTTFFSSVGKYFSQEACAKILDETKGQSENPKWREHRKGRLTASAFKNACSYSGDNINNSTVKSCLGEYADFSNAATVYGQQKEKSVRTMYAKNHGQQHSHVRIFDTGLHVNPKFAHLGASPDALVDCQECGQGCIEIKCPYTCREMVMSEACLTKAVPCTYNEDGSLTISKKSSWYYQVQGEMMVTERKYCDLLIHTNKDTICKRIQYDEAFCIDMVKKLTIFYIQFIVPRLFQ